MSGIKERIEACLANGEVEEGTELVNQYEKECPDDIDLLSMKMSLHILGGGIEEAEALALQGVRRLPLNGDMYYNLAYIKEITEQWMDAYINYYKAGVLYSYGKDAKLEELQIREKTEEALNKFVEQANAFTEHEQFLEKEEQLTMLEMMERNQFGFSETAFRDYEQIVGKYYYESQYSRRFVGVFKDQFLSKFSGKQYGHENMDVIHLKAEFLEAHEIEKGQMIHIADAKNIAGDTEYLVPIAGSEAVTVYTFEESGKRQTVVQHLPNHFNYYRVKNNTKFISSNKCYLGNPIPLRYDSSKKRLVLNIFVDGLAQCILQGEDFQQYMPYTYEYFKKGTICSRAYNTAEWTYPSIVNYVTGLDTTHHMLFHNTLDCAMPLDTPTLAEYFHKDGYYTANFSGNWRIIPAYGHARGYDRFVYQHQKVGFKVHEMIGDTLNHLEAFKEINQYLWICIGDLHDIADQDDLPADVQKDLPLELRTYESKGETSVKQSYSRNKAEMYIQEAKHIDRWLRYLYLFLEENYQEEEIVVSLFSDHGQGYLVQGDTHFLSKERSNVAFMFRGGIADGKGVVDEVVSASDYSNIMRKLAGVNGPEVPTDGRLPKVFGGNSEREYALTESIHPNDFYQAAIFAKEETFFFVNPSPVKDDGRFELAEYEYWLEDMEGNKIADDERCKAWLDIILKHIAPILVY
ncbi:MAG: sulfatase-like hydrolase/transferase [Bacteroidales bacterium]|nr:sulfatase-like hydrolase/transferase [Clostridium sp.]MCM1203841.1 sulfatase-like hydrolase/transferase [Bacteroidales bacterium]